MRVNNPLIMNKISSIYIFLLTVLMCFSTVFCTETDKCYLNNKIKNVDEEKLLNRISSLFGQTFRTEKDGFNYVIAICSDTSKLHANVSVTRSKIKEEAVILGRRNDTHLLGGDTWVMLKYDGGVKCPNGTDSQCLGHLSASIYIVCDPEKHDEPPNIMLTEIDGGHHKFVLPSVSICEHDEAVSGGTVFFIILCVAFFMYFLVGIIYRRLVHNAQGCHQLPHLSFWHKVGGLFADGCNYVCRCDIENENTWNNITSNFDSGDRDDALLSP